MNKIAIFSSGQGSTFNHLVQHFSSTNSSNSIHLLITDRKNIGVLDFAEKANIQCITIENKKFTTKDDQYKFILNKLIEHKITFIILAGYLKKIPSIIIDSFENKIINTHPSLLPKYGGKGMYGSKIHNEVIKNNERETGVTIHFVNKEYDKGKILCQEKISITTEDTAITLEKKVKAIEKKLLTKTLDKLLQL